MLLLIMTLHPQLIQQTNPRSRSFFIFGHRTLLTDSHDYTQLCQIIFPSAVIQLMSAYSDTSVRLINYPYKFEKDNILKNYDCKIQCIMYYVESNKIHKSRTDLSIINMSLFCLMCCHVVQISPTWRHLVTCPPHGALVVTVNFLTVLNDLRLYCSDYFISVERLK